MKNNVLDVALKDSNFKCIYDFGIKNGLIMPFDESFMEPMKFINISVIHCSLYDYFKRGDNIGFCLEACEYLSEMFDEYEIYKGVLPAIKGTERSMNGEHAWLISDGIIYDTSLLLAIDKSLSEYLGYIPQGVVSRKSNKKSNSIHS